MPELEAARKEYEPQGVGFLALTLDPNPARNAEVIKRLGLGIQVAYAETDMLRPYGLEAVPATLMVDAQARVVAVEAGERSRSFFEIYARTLLDRSAAQ